ncbi:hypothetical protein ElyMa_003648500 [Elysia marginata]|uniref:CCDC81 HU domain-containing protein n=1 Tax=Elysia marginata TaxID=1093978 RepID=A0AAV4EX37_9GAST|nr:hypothetical protein ElyMa_003648500 [Elysia marginata]
MCPDPVIMQGCLRLIMTFLNRHLVIRKGNDFLALTLPGAVIQAGSECYDFQQREGQYQIGASEHQAGSNGERQTRQYEQKPKVPFPAQ